MIAIDGIGVASKILAAVALAASTDETRPHINAVFVRVRKNVLDVVATNGHIMAHYVGKCESEDAQALIPLDVVEKLAKASRKASIVEFDTTKRTARVWGQASGTMVFEWPEYNATFPPFEQVTPERGIVPTAGLEGFAISTEYLIVAGKMFGVLSDRKHTSDGIYLELPKDELSPIVLSSASIPNLVLVVMPNRENRGPRRKVEKPAKVKAA
jgi:hypothetical protein